MRSLLFEQQREFGSVPWADFAKQVEIVDVEQFDACMNDGRSLQRIQQGRELGDKLGVRGTPTVIVNGWMLPVPPSSEDFDKIVTNVLDGRPPTANIGQLIISRT